MKTTIFSLLTAGVILFAVTSCDKKNGTDEINIQILSPTDGAVFNSGDTLQLKVTAADNDDLHEMKLEIKQGPNIVFGLYPYVHAKQTHTIDTSIIIPAVGSQQVYSLEAEAEDHESNSAVQVISITVNP
jgi:hypothetical protein